MTNTREQIYDALRAHPKGPRELARLAGNIPGQSPRDIVRAQQVCIDYVEQKFAGNALEFLEKYSRGDITPQDIIIFAGKDELKKSYGLNL